MTQYEFIEINKIDFFKERFNLFKGAVIYLGIVIYENDVLPIYYVNDWFFIQNIIIVDEHSRKILTNRQPGYINTN